MPRSARALASSTALLALIAGAATLSGGIAENRLRETARQAGLTADGTEFSLINGRLALTGLHARLGNADLRIGRWEGSLGTAFIAPAQAAGTTSLKDVTLKTDAVTITMPTIDVSGSSLSEGDLRALFDTAKAETLAERLAGLSANAVDIPEVIVEQKVGDRSQRLVYQRLSLRDLVNGKAASATLAGATFEVSDAGPDKVTGTFGATSVKNLDFAQTARVYTKQAGPDEPLKSVYDEFSIDGMAMQAGDRFSMKIAKMTGAGVKARPTQSSWTETLKLMAGAEKPEKLPPAERRKLIQAMVDAADAFEIGRMEITGLTFTGQDKRPGKSEPVTVNGGLKSIVLTGGDKAEFRLEGFDVKSNDGFFTIAAIGFSGFSLKSGLAAIRTELAKPDTKIEDIDFKRLFPATGTMRVTNVAMDVPKEPENGAKNGGAKGERVKLTLASFETNADKPLNGIPTTFRAALNGLAFDVPANPTEDGLKDLARMGYKSIEANVAIDGAWNEADQTFRLKEVSFGGAQMGVVEAHALLGNISKDVFSGDPAMAQVALIGATAKSIDLSIVNDGLFDRALALQAKKQGRTPDDLRKEYGSAAAVAIPAMLGGGKGAKDLGAAVARFIAKPGRLDVKAAAKDPAAGIGLADFMAAGGEPAALMEKIDITATAQ
jgi:hypothetical protein